MQIVSCDLMGGLGNQLFQLFATMAYAIKYKLAMNYINKEYLGPRPTYWDSFLLELKKYTTPFISDLLLFKETGFSYTEFPPPTYFHDNNILLYGYFQSYKYFENFYNPICNIIALEKNKKIIRTRYHYDYHNFISIHFRMGDYKKLPDCHPILSYTYYKNAIQYLIEKTNNTSLKFMYFCEEEDVIIVNEIIQKLNVEFVSCIFVKITHDICDWHQLLIMSLCCHHIIANSSFSWWGAYFNSNPNKIVCYPDVWFGEKLKLNNTADLCPPSWNKIMTI